MSANILVQHYAGQIDGDDTVHRIVLQRFSDPDPSSCEPLVSVDQVPPPSVQYSLPFLGQPEPFEAIIEALSLEMHRMQMAEAAVPAPEPEPEPMFEE
ncbi:Protein translocase subunit [Frankliniella fusca]|uniref:Protein translocase subunit n=1 Tax=Frankliniella fusca TaxID=407009 RepID=A0AAE1LUY8_9NEOP|nr:Protein translocase subunit [Frankliniella fusca]